MLKLHNRLLAVAAVLSLGALVTPRPAAASIPRAIEHPQFTQSAVASPALPVTPTAPAYVLLSVAPDGSWQVEFCRNDPVNSTDPTGLCGRCGDPTKTCMWASSTGWEATKEWLYSLQGSASLQREGVFQKKQAGEIGRAEAAAYYFAYKPAEMAAGLLSLPAAFDDYAQREQGYDLGGFIAEGGINLVRKAGADLGRLSTDPSIENVVRLADTGVDVGLTVYGGVQGYKALASPSAVAAESGSGTALLPGEGSVGTYDELVEAGSKGDNITPHHIPSKNHMAQHGMSKGDGIAVNMEQPSSGAGGRHRRTYTYGTQADVGLAPRQALGRGVWDARRIWQEDGLYSPRIRLALQAVIEQNRAANPGLFDK